MPEVHTACRQCGRAGRSTHVPAMLYPFSCAADLDQPVRLRADAYSAPKQAWYHSVAQGVFPGCACACVAKAMCTRRFLSRLEATSAIADTVSASASAATHVLCVRRGLSTSDCCDTNLNSCGTNLDPTNSGGTQQRPGTSRVRWSKRSAANPSVSYHEFGSRRLAVHDQATGAQ